MSEPNTPWYEKSEFDGAAQFSDGVLRQAGWLARIPPNAVTLFGALLSCPMFLAFGSGFIFWGAVLFAVSSVIDWLDGALARYQLRLHAAGRLDLRSHRSEWFRLGPTERGKMLDPFIDKIRYFAAIVPLGRGLLPHALIWIAAGIALALTALRALTEWRWNIQLGANLWGKFKVYGEILTIALLVFLTAGAPLEEAAYALFVIATALGLISLGTQSYRARLLWHERKDRNP
ncbi:MAG: CDP-alcohol phosphatidyltransferase family protein [Patescibacteria group bacterium]|nr:MAG: CDP-alcohol phosphatidyltransferase family protein [Patescibacteria group bacterium]